MEKNVVIGKYELMVIVDAKLANENKENVFNDAKEAVSKGEGKVINSSVWQEKSKLTFPIKKCNEGTYYLINFESKKSGIDKMRSILRLNENVLRFAITKVEPQLNKAEAGQKVAD